MYTVDGLAPEGDGWLLFLTGTGIRGLSGRMNGMLELPGVDGAVPQFGNGAMPSTLTLRYRIWVSTHAEFMGLIEKFNGVFGQRRKLLPVTHTYAPGSTRINYATVLEANPPEPVTDAFAYYNVTLTFPNPFWRSSSLLTVSSTPLTGTLTTQTLIGMDGTGPISDALIRFKGAFATARIRDIVTGDQVDVNTPATSTEYVVVDCTEWTAHRVTSDTWTGGTDISAFVSSNRGRGSMFTLEPDNVLTGGRYRVSVRATNPASTPVVEVRARKSYH
ncbi:hypothetical protein CQ010_01560 [Arthrobacter sp. MYb211]|uniref:hypothetical protein n=1 Tax=unclassified Arthrobacter TaxID=235627 RepID=UPI000CFC8F7E|nr:MULTISPECIES: hypothetical protein [unclassified Arthrobacter]PRA13361.1 hypothetical protein CQ015_03815 [Arthrobacter sp. MYb221]PRC10558.1 hypothetical protein CQ010_01560 [Arthrobacter sp. MYb211]